MRLNLQLFAYTGDSIVDYLKSTGQDSSYTARQKLATSMGIENYSGTAEQNTKLLNMLRSGATNNTNNNTVPATTTPKATTPTTTAPPVSDTTTAFKKTMDGKQTELENLGTYKYEEYVDPDYVTAAFEKINSLQHPGEFQYEYNTQLNDTINKILNREEFSYDLNGDALYQQYKDQYTTQGKQAMMDTMGQAAAMTGGYGNSYAQTVGQQTYQGYLQQLNDKVPELYKLALDQYNQEGQALYDQYGLLSSERNQAYNVHRDAIDDYNTDRDYYTDVAFNQRDFAFRNHSATQDGRYNEWQSQYNTIYDALNLATDNYWKSNNNDYTLYRDSIDDANTAKSQASEMALSMLSLGTMPSADLLAAAGISASDAQVIYDKVLADEKKTINDNADNNNKPIDEDPAADPSVTTVDFQNKVNNYTKNWDAVMRHMWGSPKTYIAQQIEESDLSTPEKEYLISYYGITENDLNYKK